MRSPLDIAGPFQKSSTAWLTWNTIHAQLCQNWHAWGCKAIGWTLLAPNVHKGSSLACFGHHFRDPEPTDPWKSFASVGTGVRKRSGPCFEHLKSSLFAWPFWRSPQTRTYRFHHRHDLESDRIPHKVNRQQLIHMQWKKIVSANCAEIAAFPPGKHTLGTQG